MACAACGSSSLTEVARVEHLPVHVGVLWPSAEAAIGCPSGELRLGFCERCGLLTNTAFDPDKLDYSLPYDNSLHASRVFREFEDALVEDLVQRHELRDASIVEVGGGRGRFLSMLCEPSHSSGVCYDPSIQPGTIGDGDVELVRDYFSTDTRLGDVDLLVCRQVLEHVPDLLGFLAPIHAALSARPVATGYLDVPNCTMLLEDLSIWDLMYEHCHYFVEESLRALFGCAGFDVHRAWTPFGEQFLSMEVGVTGEPSREPAGASEHLRKSVAAFSGHLADRRDEWRTRIAAYASDGARVVVWGAGARAVSFFAMLGITEEVAYLVDSNPAKQDTFLAGTGHPIRAPRVIDGDEVDVVVLVNGIYEAEILAELHVLSPATELVMT